MTVYSLQALRNRITDRIKIQHERAITGEEMQEILIDVVDSLAAYSPGSVFLQNFPLTSVTGAQWVDVTGYEDKFRVLDITVVLLSGIGGTIKAGLAAGGEDVLMETDISYLTAGYPEAITCAKVFASGQKTVHVTLTGTGALYDVYVTLIRMKP